MGRDIVKSSIFSFRSNRSIAVICACVVFGMVGMSFAAVPLYRIFCQITGYGGVTQRIDSSSFISDVSSSGRMIRVRFDSNIAPELPWDFFPIDREVEVPIGESHEIYYLSRNRSSESHVGMATFNVTPHGAGVYFNKIECFCFTEQVLSSGEEVRMPVLFMIDPSIIDDPDLKGVDTITLSYSFFKVAPRIGPNALDID